MGVSRPPSSSIHCSLLSIDTNSSTHNTEFQSVFKHWPPSLCRLRGLWACWGEVLTLQRSLGMSEYGCFFFFGDVKLISVSTGVAPTGPTPKNDSLKLILMNRLSL